MAKQRIINKLATPVGSRIYEEPYAFRQTTNNEIANFCLNHCPYPDGICKGNCKEIKELTRSKHRQYSRKGATEEEILSDRFTTPFGKFLRLLRKEEHETRKDMAERLDCTASYLISIEKGTSRIPKTMPNLIIDEYNLDEKWIGKMARFIKDTVQKEKNAKNKGRKRKGAMSDDEEDPNKSR